MKEEIAREELMLRIADELLSEGKRVSFKDIGNVFEQRYADMLDSDDHQKPFNKRSYYNPIKHAFETLQTLLKENGLAFETEGSTHHRTVAYPKGTNLKEDLERLYARNKKARQKQLLNRAITEGWVIAMTYNAGFQRIRQIELHPYRIKVYNRRTFVVALAVVDGRTYEDGIYALDRIEEAARKEDVRYIRPKKDYETFFDDIVGVTHVKGCPKQKVEIATLDRYTHFRILTKPIHPSQREELAYVEGGEGRISIEVVPNFELRTQIIAFGPKIKVVAPAKFTAEVKEEIRKMAEIYGL